MILMSVVQSTMAVNPYAAFCKERVRSAGLVADIVFRSHVVKLICYVEDHHGLGGNIISSLDNGAFAGLIYSFLVLTE